jgi:hypothetical protein
MLLVLLWKTSCKSSSYPVDKTGSQGIIVEFN